MSLARDIFMFSFYTRGMSFVDIALLKKKNVFPAEICYRRHKTDQLMRVGINKEISRILERYKNVPGEYIFPLFPAERDPGTLVIEVPTIGFVTPWAKISRVIGLEFPLRLHAARHSWATIAKVNGASVHVIGECLGHNVGKNDPNRTERTGIIPHWMRLIIKWLISFFGSEWLIYLTRTRHQQTLCFRQTWVGASLLH